MGITTAQPQPGDVTTKQLSDGNGFEGGGGTIFGQSPLDTISFFGQTPTVTQPVSRGSLSGKVGPVTVYSTTQTPTTVNPNSTSEQSFTVTGVAVGQLVAVNKPTAQAGLIVGSARVSGANTVAVTFGNATAASITPTATETYLVTALPASMLLTATLTPAAVQPNTTAEQFFTVAGVAVNAPIIVNKPTAQTGLIIVGADSSAANQIGITFANLTAATITPTAGEVYTFFGVQGIQVAPIEQTVTAVLSPVAVNPNTSAEQTFTVANLPIGTPVFVNKPTAQAGLGIAGARVSAANTLAITFANTTAATITPTQGETYYIASFPGTTAAAGSSTAYNAAAGGGNHADLVALGLVAGP